MGKKYVDAARELVKSANRAFRRGTIGGIEKLQEQLRALEGEVGSVRAEREHPASCVRACTSATLELQKIAEDTDVCPMDVEDAAHEFNAQCRAALLAAARRIPIDAARKKIDDACATLDEIKTTAVTWKEHSELRGALCRNTTGDGWVLFDGDEMKNRRAARRERYAATKDVPNERYAFRTTTEGQDEAQAERHVYMTEWAAARDEAARAAAMLAFSEAGLTLQPRNVVWRLDDDSTVEFKVHPQRIPPNESNPWSKDLAAVIKLEQRFWEAKHGGAERPPDDQSDAVTFDLAKRLAEPRKRYVHPAGAREPQGKFFVYVHPKGKQKAADRRYLDAGNGTKWFDREEDAIAKKFAWYRADFPGAWFCKKKGKKRGRS